MVDYDENCVVGMIQSVFEEAVDQQEAMKLSLGDQKMAVAASPLLAPEYIHREIFKFYYATCNPEKFDLFQKADAYEFLQAVLELLHFCLN